MSLLLLGGTADARRIAETLHANDLQIIYSVAGLVRVPKVPCEVLTGGFRQFGGLISYIKENNIKAILDATHPYALKMSTAAVESAKQCGIPVWRFHRPAWQPSDNDRWFFFEEWSDLMLALKEYQKILMTAGQVSQQIMDDIRPEQKVILRTAVKPKITLPANVNWIKAIGPFSIEDELKLMTKHDVDVVVSKNSGGDSTSAKLEAAREMGIPVYVLTRPSLPDAEIEFNAIQETIDHCIRWYLAAGNISA